MPITKERKSRKDSRYTRDEMQVLNKHKNEYREQTTRQLRYSVFKGKILTDLFNHWLKQGTTPKTEEESATRVKELAAWVRNNWRPLSTTLETKAFVKVTVLQVVCDTEREAVEAELMDILGVDQLEPNNPHVFQQRNAAAKRVLDKMSERERTKLKAIVEERKTKGHPDHIRRERAEKYREKIIRKWSKERWLDMGMATITFTVHTDRRGRLIADVHDNVLDNVGLTGTRFTLKNDDRVTEMKVAFLDFMKSLRVQAPEAINPVRIRDDNDGTEPEPETDADVDTAWDIKMTPEGYPILPNAIGEKEVSKAEGERIMQEYIMQHYYLASRKKNRRVPYGAFKEDTPAFVMESSVPAGFILNDPRNIQRAQIQNLLRHWCERQERLGPELAFGFRLVMGPKKKRVSAEYPPRVGENMEAAPKASTRRKGKQREIPQLEGLLPISQHCTPDPTGTPAARASPVHSGMTPGIPPAWHSEDELVKIDMGQMVLLRNMGHNVMGPVNGPNEGPPQYEVPRLWLQQLERETMASLASAPGPSTPRPYPRPRPINTLPATHHMPPIIDPALVGQPQGITQQQQQKEGPDPPSPIAIQSGPRPDPQAQITYRSAPLIEHHSGTGPEPDTSVTPVPGGSIEHPHESDPDSTSAVNAATVLGKRSTVVRSPPRPTQAQKTRRRKVVTGDDLAYQEAQALLKGGINKRSRKKKQPGN